MYILNIMVKTETDRTEEDFYFATLQECYGKIASFATNKGSNPTDEMIDFKINKLRGTLPVDIKIG